MIYILRTLWILFYIPVFLLECITFVLGVFISPCLNGIKYIKMGEYGDFNPAIVSEYIEKEYDKLREQIENLNNYDDI